MAVDNPPGVPSQALGLRRGTPADVDTVAGFNVTMARETEGVSLDPEVVRAGVAAVFADDSKGFYLLATRGDAVVGQLMVTYEWSDWRNGVIFWIQSVYVSPSSRRTGVYRALYDSVVTTAKGRADVAGVRLYVHHDNHPAQATYRSLGMHEGPYRLFEVDFVVTR